MRILAHLYISFALGIIILIIWQMLANANDWLYFSGWAMAHGGFIIALPVSWAIAFGGLLLIPWFRKGWPRFAIVGTAVLLTAFFTVTFWLLWKLSFTLNAL
jgi:drug/metabolite transporter superfamily protein YnfA